MVHLTWNKVFAFLILDNLAALKDLWFMGDAALLEIFHTLPVLRREARIAKKSQPYVYSYYNGTALQMSASAPQLSNVLTRFLDSFIEGLN